jgi:hypothetical protein
MRPNLGSIFDTARPFSFGAKLAVYFDFDTLHNDTALRSFPVDVIAVAGCKREKQQLTAVSA